MLLPPDDRRPWAGERLLLSSPDRVVHRTRGFIVCLSALALAGCATAPPVREADVSLPSGYSAADAAMPAIQLDRWWLHYGDAQLTDLEERALSRGFS